MTAASAARRSSARRTTARRRSRRRRRRGPSARTGPCGSRRRAGRCGRSARAARPARLQQPQRLEPEWPVAAVDEEAGPVGGVDHAPCPSPRRPRERARAPAARLLAGDDLEQRITGAGLKKCMPTTRSGSAAAGGDRGHQQRRGVRRQHAVLGRRSPTAGEQLALELERTPAQPRSRARTGARSSSAGAGLEPARSAAAPAPRCSRPRSTPRRSCRADRLEPALERLGHRVVQQRARAGEAGELRDAGAHRAGADDADRLGIGAPSGAWLKLGTSALIPVSGAPDDQLLDLRGALVQGRHADVAEVALDRVVVDVARAAVDLDRGVGAARPPPRSRTAWRSRSPSCSGLPGVLEEAGAPDEHPRGVGLHHHVGDHRLHELEAGDRPAELLALLGVAHRGVDAALADADAAGGDAVAARSPARSSRP